MKLQLHIGSTSMRDILPVRNEMIKPFGGFWTSSYVNGTSEWIQFCEKRTFRLSDISTWEGMLLEVNPSSKIYTINTVEDLIYLVKEYKFYSPSPEFHYISYPNFEGISQDYDGIHLTSEGQLNTRYSYPYTLYGWDVESTLWFRNCFTSCKTVQIEMEMR